MWLSKDCIVFKLVFWFNKCVVKVCFNLWGCMLLMLVVFLMILLSIYFIFFLVIGLFFIFIIK